MTRIDASLITRSWRKVDIKLSIDGKLHVLRWRRGWFVDEVLFDDRRIATSTGLFGREAMFGLDLKTEAGEAVRLLFSVDGEPVWNDWTGEMRPRGVRLETADEELIAFGSLGGARRVPFEALFGAARSVHGL